jgi:hypothetical protein
MIRSTFMSQKWKSWLRAGPAREDNMATSDSREPSLVEVLLMFAMVFFLHFWTLCRVRNFWDVAAYWSDNEPYLGIVTIIRNWHFSGGERPWHFWGFPYAIAGVSKLFSIPGLAALVMISMLGSLAVCVLAHRLYGGWVATAFLFINYRWIVGSAEGGSEPLFMCLLYAAFLAARSDRWNIAALLASLSTTVRPVGVIALLCFAIVLTRRKSYRQLAVISLTGLTIGVLYVIPLWVILGNPFENFSAYQGDWGPHGWPLTYPFGALVPSFLALFHKSRWPILVMCSVWVFMAVAGTIAIWLSRHREKWSMYQPEALFTSMYTLFFLSYNFADIAGDLPRFLLPVVPLLLFSLHDWIPKDRRVLWAAAVMSALLSSAAMVGFKNVFGFRLP